MRIALCDDQMDEEVINIISDGGPAGAAGQQGRRGSNCTSVGAIETAEIGAAAVHGSSVARDLTYSGCCRNYWAASSSPAL